MFKRFFDWLTGTQLISNWILLIVILCLTAAIAFSIRKGESKWLQK